VPHGRALRLKLLGSRRRPEPFPHRGDHGAARLDHPVTHPSHAACVLDAIRMGKAEIAREICAHCVGVEYDRLAIKSAQRNAESRKISNGEFISATVEEVLPELLKKFSALADGHHNENKTAVILDPPRKGCLPETLNLLRETKPAQVIYVSCHPATMARDLNILCADGVFELACVQPLDMFPQTAHIECVAVLEHQAI